MSRVPRKDLAAKVSLSIPRNMLEETDALCAANFMTRSAWFLQSAREKLEKERFEKSKNLLNQLKTLE